MAKFLVTSGVTYKLEELIKGTEDKLILISPYLQFSKRIKDNIANLNILKRDIRIIFRENKLQVEESNWLETQIGVRTSICSTLHAKCYLNEKEAIVTSMNLYTYSQNNNDEMGIYVTKAEDPDLFEEITVEAQRLLRISDEIRISVKKIDKKAEDKKRQEISKKEVKSKDYSKSKYKSTSALSKIIGISSKELFEMFEKKGWIKKDGKTWILTSNGERNGGQMKKGQYGEYAAWPEEIIKEIDDLK